MDTPASTPMIEAIGLSKFYRDFAAIRDVTFSIPAGRGNPFGMFQSKSAAKRPVEKVIANANRLSKERPRLRSVITGKNF
jgi:ABC-type Na+ transport system ATPase subunit NatA